MEKLKTPLIDSEYAKINSFYQLKKKQLYKPNGKGDLEEFIQKNKIFSEYISDLPKSEKILAWLYLRNLVLSSNSDVTSKVKGAETKIKDKLIWVYVVIILCIFAFVFYSCSSSKPPKAKVKDNSEYMTECQKMIKYEAKYPSSVDHKVFSTKVHHAKNGNVLVIAPFSAKNGFGTETEHTARCIFSNDGNKEITIVN